MQYKGIIENMHGIISKNFFFGTEKVKPMTRKTFRFLITTVMLSLFFFLFPTVPGEGKEETYRILLLNSYHDGFSWTDGITKGIRETLQSYG